MTNYYICDIESVADYQQKYNITKTLSLINDYHKKEYMNPDYTGEHTIINVRDHEWYQNEHSPTHETVYNIMKFCDTINDDDNVLVHCIGGISRSPAAMLIILKIKYGFETACEMLDSIKPNTIPNCLICRLFDDNLYWYAKKKQNALMLRAAH